MSLKVLAVPLKGAGSAFKGCWQRLQRVPAVSLKGAGSAFEGCQQRLQRVPAVSLKGAGGAFDLILLLVWLDVWAQQQQ